MYIEPNSTLYILKDCPLDTTYDHTLWFNTDDPTQGKIDQFNYFHSLRKHTLEYETGNKFTYLRVNKGRIKVPFKADDLYDCNYIMFRNTNYGNKWFYAFIKSVEYVNKTTSEIVFELDVMQTWHFDYEIDECFVEREHSVTDVVGTNTLPEAVDLGDYISDGLFGTEKFNDWVIIVVRTNGGSLVDVILDLTANGGFYNGSYQQVEFDVIEPTEDGINALKGFLDGAAVWNNLDVVAGMYMLPRNLVVQPTTNLEESLDDGKKITAFDVCTVPVSLGDYTPKNKKLLTYPYSFLGCTNFEGTDKAYKYEYFKEKDGVTRSLHASFALFVDFNIRPTVMLAPVNYMSYYPQEDYQANLNESICIGNLPECTYLVSDAGAKFVQAATSILLSGMATPSVSTTEISGERKVRDRKGKVEKETITGTKTTTTKSGHESVAQTLISGIASAGVESNIGRGNIFHSANGGLDFGFRRLHIRPEYARIIDDYFSCFGYATKRLKHPNRSSRPHWNYVKTINCTIKGSIPCDDLATICGIYDNGITFWKNGNEVGQYSLDNSPI